LEARFRGLDGALLDWEPKSDDSLLNSPLFKAAKMALGVSKSSEASSTLRLVRQTLGLAAPLNYTINVGQTLRNVLRRDRRHRELQQISAFVASDGTFTLGTYSDSNTLAPTTRTTRQPTQSPTRRSLAGEVSFDSSIR
jgi:hypothetical protein